MKLSKKIINILKPFDLFSSNILLRYKQQTQYSTLASSFVSACILLTCLIIFIQKLYFHQNHVATSVINQSQQNNPQLFKQNIFAIALTIQNMNIYQMNQYFNISMKKWIFKNNFNFSQNISMKPCTINQKKKYSSIINQNFDKYNFYDSLCTDQNFVFQLQGKNKSPNQIFYQIQIQKCIGINCKNQNQIKKFLIKNHYFSISHFIIKTNIYTNKQDPFTYSIEDSKFQFTPQLGFQNILYYSKLSLVSDQSLFPIGRIKSQSKLIFDKSQFKYIPSSNPQIYVSLKIMRSTKCIQIYRKFIKITDIMSYIGGLFSIITTLFKFIFSTYNLWSYQLSLATQIFSHNCDKTQDKSLKSDNIRKYVNKKQKLTHQVQNFNFFKFLSYILYKFIKFLGLNSLYWIKMQAYDIALSNVLKQTDINIILKKLIFLSRITDNLFTQDQINLIHIQEKYSYVYFQDQRFKYDYQLKLRDKSAKSDNIKEQEQKMIATLHKSFYAQLNKKNQISDKIIQNIDPIIKQKLFKFIPSDYQMPISNKQEQNKNDKNRMQNNVQIMMTQRIIRMDQVVQNQQNII